MIHEFGNHVVIYEADVKLCDIASVNCGSPDAQAMQAERSV